MTRAAAALRTFTLALALLAPSIACAKGSVVHWPHRPEPASDASKAPAAGEQDKDRTNAPSIPGHS